MLCRLELANDDNSSDEGGWGDDDAAPTLKELPKLPQVEEAHKAPWQRSGEPHVAWAVTKAFATLPVRATGCAESAQVK